MPFLRSRYPASEAVFLAVDYEVPSVLATQLSPDVPQSTLYEVPPDSVATLFPTEKPNLLTSRSLGMAPSTRNPVCPALAPPEDSIKVELFLSLRLSAAPFSSGLPFL